MHSCVTSKNAKWCHLIWPTLYAVTFHDKLAVVDGATHSNITLH